MTRYISCTETAKLVRVALKNNFKGIKFSVKSRSYSGGASIEVSWTNGPTSKAVEKIAKQFQGSTFDGMTDSRDYHTSTLNGEEVRFGADSVSCGRSYTREFVEAIITQFCRVNGCDASKIRTGGTDENYHADAWNLGSSDDHYFNELLRGTDEKNLHRAYDGMEETKQQEAFEYGRNEPQRRKEAQARAAREREEAIRAEQARAKREQARQEQSRSREMPMQHTSMFASRQEALRFLNVSLNATDDQIKAAFRAKVKHHSDGHGGYIASSGKVDMDKIVQAKRKALQRS